MEIEFDPEKAAANPANHEGVTFEEARHVLFDPFALTREDVDANGEQRFGKLTNPNGDAMNNSSDPLFDDLVDLDFAEAKPVAEVPALARLQAERGNQSQVTMRVDNRILAAFTARAEMVGSNYQTLMNDALQQFVEGQTLADVVRETIRRELHQDGA